MRLANVAVGTVSLVRGGVCVVAAARDASCRRHESHADQASLNHEARRAISPSGARVCCGLRRRFRANGRSCSVTPQSPIFVFTTVCRGV